jgi:hypothetical protein
VRVCCGVKVTSNGSSILQIVCEDDEQSNLHYPSFLCHPASECHCAFLSEISETSLIPQDSVMWERQQSQEQLVHPKCSNQVIATLSLEIPLMLVIVSANCTPSTHDSTCGDYRAEEQRALEPVYSCLAVHIRA